jgi:hypothetical protein
VAREDRMGEAAGERIEIGEVDSGHDLLHVRSIVAALRGGLVSSG